MSQALADHFRFVCSLLADPRRVAAIAPSGEALARLITSEIIPLKGPVLELGPGTGVFTRALLNRGLSPADLTLVEQGREFIHRLEREFPGARVLRMDATDLNDQDLFEVGSVSAVISGLPLLSMPPRKVVTILTATFLYLKPGAAFYQFTYSYRCPVRHRILDSLGLKSRRIGGTMRNLPPASVYKITRR